MKNLFSSFKKLLFNCGPVSALLLILCGGFIGTKSTDIIVKAGTIIQNIPTFFNNAIASFSNLGLFTQSFIFAISIVVFINSIIKIIKNLKSTDIKIITNLKNSLNTNICKNAYIIFKLGLNFIAVILIFVLYIAIKLTL